MNARGNPQANCPHCGAPTVAAAVGAPHWKIIGIVLTLAVLGMLGSTLWRMTPRSASGMALDRSGDAVRATPAVYQTTAEQLYQDYNANGVATQTRIGNGNIRVSGKIASVEEDAAGHPVVKLATNHERGADMTLTDDQTAAAAQLARGQNVDIQCGSMRGIDGVPVGSRCMLALVAAASTTPAAVAGSPSSDSRATAATQRAVEATPRAQVPHAASVAAVATPAPGPAPPRAPMLHSTPASGRIVSPVPPAVAAPEPESDADASDAQQRPAAPVNAGSGTSPAPATAPAPTPGAPAPDSNPEAVAGLASPTSTPLVADAGGPAAADDLASVRKSDPQAADHIASYCANSVGERNGVSFAASCRRDETDAWTRFVLNNEFPTLDEDTRRKCNEPPFPDTYTAKETCARYLLGKTSTSAQR